MHTCTPCAPALTPSSPPSPGTNEVKHLSAEQAKDSSHFKDKETGAELEVQERMPLLEWLANSYKKFGCQLEFVTNKSQEGSQFCRGFGGVGGILRYQVRAVVAAGNVRCGGAACCVSVLQYQL